MDFEISVGIQWGKPAQIRDSGRPYTLSHTSYSWLEVQLTTQKQLQLV